VKSERAALPVALLALIVGTIVLAIVLSSGEDAPPDLTAIESRCTSLEGRLDELSDAVTEMSRHAKRTAGGLEGLHEKVDDLARLAEKLEETAGRPPRSKIEPGVKLHDTFEAGTDGWAVLRFIPIVIGDLEQTTQEGHAKEGRGALALSYELAEGKIPLIVRGANHINRLSLWIRTLQRPADIHVGVTEFDESRYGVEVHLEADEGWRHLEFDMATFVLAEDSFDENGGLDYDRMKGLSIADIGGFRGNAGANTLLVDEIIGEYRAEEDEKPAPGKDAF